MTSLWSQFPCLWQLEGVALALDRPLLPLSADAAELFLVDCIECSWLNSYILCLCRTDFCYAKRWALTISLQIVANGSHNPSSNSLPTLLEFADVAQVMAAVRRCYYGAPASFWRCERWHCKDRPTSSFLQRRENKRTPKLLEISFQGDNLPPTIEPKIFIFWRSVSSPITKVTPYLQTAT
jgi:hypothetical protein